jgi:hypothetical protein
MVTTTLTADSIQTGFNVDGLDFYANNQTWIIDPNVTVFSRTIDGVFSNFFANNTLINHGRIYAAGSNAHGVFLEDGNATILNAVGAEIFGSFDGVELNGSGNSAVNNLGTIIGATNVGVFFDSNTHGVVLNNHGYIFGYNVGVTVGSGGTINNFHTIRAHNAAIFLDTGTNVLTHITNTAGGVIDGSIDSIFVTAGKFHLTNYGTIIGSVVADNGANDVIINHGSIHGAVYLDGNSVFNGTGGHSGPIHVGSGNDILTGGPGTDHFVFDAALTGQVEKITNFNPNLDRFVLSDTDFAGIGTIGHPLAAADFHIGGHATKAWQHIIYNPNTGFLFYDSDGNGPSAQIHFATIGTHLAMTHTDFLVEA